MNGKCEKCFYYSGDNVLLPHCFRLNSAIVPGWNKYNEDKDCPEFVNKEDYYNKLKDFLDANIDQFIKSEVKGNKLQLEQVSSKHHYIGKYVHAGGELNGITGHIIDVKHESDDIFGEELWFYIKDEEDGTIHKYGKEEIQEIVIGITYKDLE
jgi:hypothetical protein